jgi:hypothetical protein
VIDIQISNANRTLIVSAGQPRTRIQGAFESRTTSSSDGPKKALAPHTRLPFGLNAIVPTVVPNPLVLGMEVEPAIMSVLALIRSMALAVSSEA